MLGNLGGGSADRDSDDQITQAGNVDAFALKVGDCLVTSAIGETFSDVPGVPCTTAHDSEVTYIFDMPDGTYDSDAIDEAGYQECEAAAINYVGPNYTELGSQGLDWNYFSPTEDSWAQGDREIDCIIYTLSGDTELTSSVKGQGN